MKKYLIVAVLLASGLFAEPRPTELDLDACYQRNMASEFTYNGLRAVALTRHLAAVIHESNNTLKPGEFIKYDPYLKLYLISTETTEVAPHLYDETDLKNCTWVNVLEQNTTQIGRIRSYAKTLGEFDKINFEANKTGLLLNDCCQMLGIAIGGDNFIGNRYLRNFIAHKNVYYGDIGVNFDDMNGTFSVRSVYPLGPGAALQEGDRIISVNGKIPRFINELNEAVLFADYNSTLNFEIMRNGQAKSIVIKMAPQQVAMSDKNATAEANKTEANATKKQAPAKKKVVKKPKQNPFDALFDSYGFSVDGTLTITSIRFGSPVDKAGFKVGDKIMKVGRHDTETKADLHHLLNNYQLNHVLVSRDDFQFHIRLRR
nr:PDZ domain-containing protein [Campylobacter sp.]